MVYGHVVCQMQLNDGSGRETKWVFTTVSLHCVCLSTKIPVKIEFVRYIYNNGLSGRV